MLDVNEVFLLKGGEGVGVLVGEYTSRDDIFDDVVDDDDEFDNVITEGIERDWNEGLSLSKVVFFVGLKANGVYSSKQGVLLSAGLLWSNVSLSVAMAILMWEVSSSSNVAFSINVDKELDDGIEGLIVEIMDGRSVS